MAEQTESPLGRAHGLIKLMQSHGLTPDELFVVAVNAASMWMFKQTKVEAMNAGELQAFMSKGFKLMKNEIEHSVKLNAQELRKQDIMRP